MRAIILAAGYGRRLAAVHSGPKSLLVIGGSTLMQRHLENLEALGIEHIGVCVGYDAAALRQAIEDSGFSTRVTTVLNPDYREGSIISLWHMRHFLLAGGDVLLMDADVLCRPDMLDRLHRHSGRSAFLLDRDFEPGPEPVKLCVRSDRLVEFRKQVADGLEYDFAGESVGFFRFEEAMASRLARRTEAYLQAGRREEPYEEAIRDLLLEDPAAFEYEDVTGIPWLEIDFPEDIDRANNEVLPRITGSRD
jgi:choline kinase